MALIDEKTARHMLYAMFQHGFVFIQDVPKTSDHQASRTAFLYYIDIRKSTSIMLSNAYKTFYRLRLRFIKEQDFRRVLIVKSNRTDVKTGQAHLSVQELESLEQLRSIEAKIFNQCRRLDDLVFLLRDL